MSTLKQKKKNKESLIKKYEKLYIETGDNKYKDLMIKHKRELVKLCGGSLQSNNLYTSNYNIHFNSTGQGLIGQH